MIVPMEAFTREKQWKYLQANPMRRFLQYLFITKKFDYDDEILYISLTVNN